MEVEHTHGTAEMGADFVLSQTDEIFPDIKYVGVIAKIGKISQDYTTLERQIKECEIERLFANGKQKIYLTEIWILTTGSISNNAKIKIHTEYKTRNIKFIDGERLSALIDANLPNFSAEVPLDIGDYLHGIWSANEHLDKTLTLVKSQSENFYIDQDVVEAKEFDKNNKKKGGKKVDIHEQIARNSVILLEGGMGAGKSKLLRNLVHYYSDPAQFISSKLLPLSLNCKDFVEKFASDPNKVVEAFVPAQVQKCKPEGSQYLLLLDGADEQDLPAGKLPEAVGSIAAAVDAAKMKAVITSRWCEGYEGSSALRSCAKRLELSQLSTGRLIEFIRRLCRDVDLSSRLVEDLKKSALFKELPKSPIAAILLAQLINENAKDR